MKNNLLQEVKKKAEGGIFVRGYSLSIMGSIQGQSMFKGQS
jgi:hypothetical protein